jgi:hypothetical protein
MRSQPRWIRHEATSALGRRDRAGPNRSWPGSARIRASAAAADAIASGRAGDPLKVVSRASRASQRGAGALTPRQPTPSRSVVSVWRAVHWPPSSTTLPSPMSSFRSRPPARSRASRIVSDDAPACTRRRAATSPARSCPDDHDVRLENGRGIGHSWRRCQARSICGASAESEHCMARLTRQEVRCQNTSNGRSTLGSGGSSRHRHALACTGPMSKNQRHVEPCPSCR